MLSRFALIKFAIVFVLALSLAVLEGCGGKTRPVGKADYDVIVIGGGLGGLSAAAQLSAAKMKVLLLEQHYKVGGSATNFTRGDFTFEVALHEMDGAGPLKKGRKREGAVQQLIKDVGVDKKVTLIEHKDLYRAKFPGIDITLPAGWDGVTGALKAKWPEESGGIDEFRRICISTVDEAMSVAEMFRYSSLKKLLTMALVPVRQRMLFKWSDKTLKELMDHCFKGEGIKAAVSQFWAYLGPPPDEQSALQFMLAFDSYAGDGAFHIRGTSQALSDAYAERIREMGGVVKTGMRVKKIIIQNGIATGVQTESGEKFTSRYIVANTDPYQLVFTLVGEEHFPKKYVKMINSLKPANSLFGVFLGLNIDLKKRGYRDFEIFYNTSTDTRKMYDSMMKGDVGNGTVVMAIYTNLNDPSYAPKGKSVVKLDAYSDYALWPEDKKAYEKLKKKKMDELIKLAARVIPELADPRYVEVKEGYTPRTLNRFTLNRGGVVYGYSFTPEQFDRIPNDTPIDNVFIASNWTQASHGYSGVQINGWQAARLIMDREGIK